MANIRSIISSFLLIMQTNNGILARIEFMVGLNSILLLILFVFDTYRRRSRSKLVKYILLVVDAASHSMVFHTLGLMQSAPISNNLFEVWANLLVALRFGTNYIAVYGLREQRAHWNMELSAALASHVWVANLNGTRNSDFRTPLWVLWVLQPLRIGYMYRAYGMACRSYRQGRSSVLIADYMENENEQLDHEVSSNINKNDSTDNSEYKPKSNNPNDDCGVGPRSDSMVSDRRGKPKEMVEQLAETETTHKGVTKAKKVNVRTNSRSLKKMEEIDQKTDYQEPGNCNPNAEPQWRVREADMRTNVEVPSSSGAFGQSSLRGYPNLIQGKTSRSVYEIEEVSEKTNYQEPSSCYPNTEPQSSIGEADVRTNVEVPISNGAYDPSSMRGYSNFIQDETSRSVNEIEEVSEKTYQEPSSCYPNAKPQSSIGEADVRTNVEVPISSGAYDPSSMRGYQYIIQGETWQVVEVGMLKLEGKLQLTVTRKEKLITLEKIWNCKGKLLGEWGDKDGQFKDLCLSYALYRLLRCRFDNFPLPEKSIPKTRSLLVDNILSRTKNHESTKKGNKGPEELQEGTIKENEGTEEQQGGTNKGNKSPKGQGNDHNNQYGVVWYLYLIIAKMKWALCFFFKKEKQQDRSKAEENEDEVTEEVALRVFQITGTELSFLNDYMYSRFPVIFWRGRGLIVSLFLYIAIVASTCWIGICIVYGYTPDKDELALKINGTNIDVLITWSMLVFIVFKETWEILIYLFSDWTKVVLISMYVERTCTWNWLMENLIWLLCKCSMIGQWHGKIDQYNFLEAYNYKPRGCMLAYYLSLGSLPKANHGVESKNLIVLPIEVKKAIVKSISSLLKEEPKRGRLSAGGMPSILSRNNVNIAATSQISELQGLHTSFVKREQELHTCSHIILVWHIATSLCEIELCQHYNIHLAYSELPSLWSSLNFCSSEPFLVKLERLGKDKRKNFIVANSLSRYCAHLLINQPLLLADNIFIAEEIFKHAVHEARSILEGCDTLQSIYKRLMEGGKEIKSKNENTIMRRGARLGKILIETLDEEARWKALAGVWADLLVYMAPNPNVDVHKECLATGGELITHVWILLYHAGIVENSLVDQEEDIENLDDIVQNCFFFQGPVDQEEENDIENPDVDQGQENDAEESSLNVVIHQGEEK